ncbi:MAG: energy-coupling factor transporter transmembrane component T [Chloroflexota bacterium]
MAQAFSLFAPRPSALHRLHPLTKLSLAGFLFAAGLILPGALTPYFVFLIFALPLAALGKVTREWVAAAWRVTLPFAISVFLVQGFFWPRGTPLVFLGPLSLKSEGLVFATTSTGRILVVVGSFLLLALTTRPDMLMRALTQSGLPGSIAYIIVATIQIVPRFQAKAAAILDAQRARGLETEGNLVQRLRAILPLVVPLVLGSLVDVEERAIAIEARAFNRPGPKTSLIEITEAAWEPLLRWVIVGAMVGMVGLSVWLR